MSAATPSLHPVDPEPRELDAGRRDRKKLATRRALRWAAVELVAERGYLNVTVEDIAEAADVSPRTFFNYFSSKEAAVVGEDANSLNALVAGLADAPADEPVIESLRRLVRERGEHFAREAEASGVDPQAWVGRMKTVHGDPHLRAAVVAHIETYERLIVSEVASRLGTDPAGDPYPTLLAAAAMAAVRVAIMYWAKSGGIGTPGELADRAFLGLARGLPTDGSLAACYAELAAGPGPRTLTPPAEAGAHPTRSSA